jgi:hypothetical protein
MEAVHFEWIYSYFSKVTWYRLGFDSWQEQRFSLFCHVQISAMADPAFYEYSEVCRETSSV